MHTGLWIRSIVVTILASVAAPAADACSWAFEDLRTWQLTAPVGGVWWMHGVAVEQVDIVRRRDGAVFSAPVVGGGPGSTIVLRVPDGVADGDEFDVDTTEYLGRATEEGLRVVGALATTAGPVERPDLQVGTRERRVGYEGGITLPNEFFPCTKAPGFWNHHYAEGAFAAVVIPEGLALDLMVRPEGEGAFDPATSANQIALEAFSIDDVDIDLHAPPGTDTDFVVHARFRRLQDGAASEVVSRSVSIDPGETVRTEWVGCSAGPGVPGTVAVVGLLGLLRRRRRA